MKDLVSPETGQSAHVLAPEFPAPSKCGNHYVGPTTIFFLFYNLGNMGGGLIQYSDKWKYLLL